MVRFITHNFFFIFSSLFQKKPRNQSTSSFTLIELLIVIGILAILTAAVVIVLNPTELLKQGRDSTRMTDLASLSKTIQTALTQDATASLGVSTTIAVSLPDTSATCANLGLPVLPAGYTYRCVTQANLTKTDGTGWIPYNFQTSGINMLSKIPLDPTNTTSTGLYYIFIGNQSTFQILSFLESNKYHHKAVQDAGTDPDRFEVGSTFSSWIIPSGLVGWWPLAQDSERLGGELINNGSFSGSSPWSLSQATTNNNYLDVNTGTAYTDFAVQNISNLNPLNKTYQIIFNVNSITSGSVRIFIGGYNASNFFTDLGLKSLNLRVTHASSNNNIYISAGSSGFIGNIDDISIREFKSGDISGNNNHGSFIGTTYSQNQRGESNKAMSFDGTSSYIEILDNPSLTPQTSETIMLWVKRTSYNTSICNILRRNSMDMYSFMCGQSSDTVLFKIYTTTGTFNWCNTGSTNQIL